MADQDDYDGAGALLSYVGAGEEDHEFAAEKYAEAHALVTDFVGGATVPHAVFRPAVLEVGSKLFQRRSAPGGQAEEFGLGSTPTALPTRDPLVTVYATLRRFVGPGFA